jgi:transposase InsO family protein
VPWKVQSPMSIRQEFIVFASQPDANVSALCRRYGVSRKAAYKWLARWRAGGDAALADRSRRPKSSPARTDDAIAQQIVALRQQHPAWGARKLRRRLQDLGGHAAADLPARSTVNDILSRHGLIDPEAAQQHTPHQRFERERPNELWQIDFKGHFATGAGGRCHPLTALDDCSRFNVLLRACDDERLETVQAALTETMRRYGMPEAILSDNGPPWGNCGQDGNWTTLGLWLLRRGVRVLHGRPYHPQTQGKEERFHRTLKAEAIGSRCFRDTAECQRVFDDWREVYNLQRPHEALAMATPATRYMPATTRPFIETPPAIEYSPGDAVRKVCAAGRICYRGGDYRIGKAFIGERVAVRPTTTDGLMEVYYCHQRVAEIDLRVESEAR